jgi:hypothetical protein
MASKPTMLDPGRIGDDTLLRLSVARLSSQTVA